MDTFFSKSMSDGNVVYDKVVFQDETELDTTNDIAFKSEENIFTADTNTFDGLIVAPSAPTLDTHLTNKLYVDNAITAETVSILSSNNTFTGSNTYNNVIVAPTAPSLGTHLTNKSYTDTSIATSITNLKAANNTFTGSNIFENNVITLAEIPTSNAHLTSKSYVDSEIANETIGILARNNTFTGSNEFSNSLTTTGISNTNNMTFSTEDSFIRWNATQKFKIEDYFSNDNRFGLGNAGSGQLKLYISNTFTPSSISFSRALTATTYTDLMRIAFNGDTNIYSTTDSTDNTSGALVVAGGVGIAGNTNVGGDITGLSNTYLGGLSIKSVQAVPILTGSGVNAFFTSSNLTVATVSSGYEYALTNGLEYNVSYSTQGSPYSTGDSSAYTMYNNNSNTNSFYWGSATQKYFTNGTYKGSASTNTDNGAVLGEYTQIRFPYLLKMTSFTIQNYKDSGNGRMKNFVLVGSNDGASWITVLASIITSGAGNYISTFTTTQSEYYRWYRIIATTTYTGTVYGVGITKMEIFGDVYTDFSNLNFSITNKTLQIEGGIGATEDINIGSTNVSTNYTNGALVVAGGVGIAGNTNVNGNITANGTLDISGASVFKSDVSITSTTPSTTYTTGALVVSGGVGIAGDMNISGNINRVRITNNDGSTNQSSIVIDEGSTDLTTLMTSDKENFVFGKLNLTSYTGTGTHNVAIGLQNLQNLTTGSYNTAVGCNVLKLATGQFNVGMGEQVLSSTTTGGHNVAMGYNSLRDNVIGGYNTAIGENSGDNAIGSQNTFIGYNTNTDNVLAAYNNSTAIGQGATITASHQIVLGVSGSSVSVVIPSTKASSSYQNGALVVNGGVGISGNFYVNNKMILDSGNSVAVGGNSLQNVSTGYQNTAIGNNALSGQTTGAICTAIGYNSGTGQSTALYNTYLGASTGTSNSAYRISTAVGYGATITADGQIVLGRTNEYVKIPSTATTALEIGGGINIAGGNLDITSKSLSSVGNGSTGTYTDFYTLPSGSGVYFFYINRCNNVGANVGSDAALDANTSKIMLITIGTINMNIQSLGSSNGYIDLVAGSETRKLTAIISGIGFRYNYWLHKLF